LFIFQLVPTHFIYVLSGPSGLIQLV
jgi:hypothetical protein